MSWFKKKKVEATKHYIPKAEIFGVLERFDYAKEKNDRRSRYALWIEISSIFPGLDIRSGGWELTIENVLRPYIQKEDAK